MGPLGSVDRIVSRMCGGALVWRAKAKMERFSKMERMERESNVTSILDSGEEGEIELDIDWRVVPSLSNISLDP